MARGSRWWQLVWYNFTQLFRWYRVAGIIGLSIAAYFLVFVVLGNMNVGWLLPESKPHFYWPDLPHFMVWSRPGPKGQGVETIYTVPTRQITKQEMSELPAATNAVARPAPAH